MSLPVPPTIAQQSLQIVDWIGQLVRPLGGVSVAASNLRDMWNQASQQSNTLIVYTCWMGDQSRGGDISRWVHRVDREWATLVKRGRGLSANRGDSLNKTVGNADPFYDDVEAVRDRIRAILSISEEGLVEFRSARPWQLGNLILDAMLLTYVTANDLPTITLTPQNQVNPI